MFLRTGLHSLPNGITRAESAESGITQTKDVIIQKSEIKEYTRRFDYASHIDFGPDNFKVYLVDGARKDTAWNFASADWGAYWRIQMNGSQGWDHLTIQ